MKFSNILISKKQFLCNKKPYCTLVPCIASGQYKNSKIEPYVIHIYIIYIFQ